MSDTVPVFEPLASRLRPQHAGQFIGQLHLLAEGKPLRVALDSGTLHSMILWGPPGTGKTTLAYLLAKSADAYVEKLSAVLSGVKDIREAVARAKDRHRQNQGGTILFVDEVHRFNKSQQDAFLPYLEDGTVVFIGATTENPSFELNNALLSRARVYVLQSLSSDELLTLIQRAVAEAELDFDGSLHQLLASAADGDARRALNYLEVMTSLAEQKGGKIDSEIVNEVIAGRVRRFDKQGEDFYDQISALHKSVRGSDPDAALYWLARMIDGGCSHSYILRRMVRMASEDIGNADPRALQITLNAWDSFDRLGSPEGELAMAQALVYMAIAAKSNAVYKAWGAAMQCVKEGDSLAVPLHLRNAPTKLMKQLNYGKAYRYAHDEPHGYAAGENYFPKGMTQPKFYAPVERGMEKQIKQKLAYLKSLDKGS